MPTSTSNASRVEIQEPRTRSHPLHPSPIAFKEQQGQTTPAGQQTIAGKFCRNLFKGLLFSELTLVSLLVIVLTIRGLISASSHHFHPRKWYPPLLASVAVSGVASIVWQCIFVYNPLTAFKVTFWLGPILTCSVGILLVLIGSAKEAGVGAVFSLFGIIQSLYGCWITPRVDYTNKILSLSTAFPRCFSYHCETPDWERLYWLDTCSWKKFRSIIGLEKLIDSDLTSSFCFLSAVSVGAVSSLTAGIWTLIIHKDYALEVIL